MKKKIFLIFPIFVLLVLIFLYSIDNYKVKSLFKKKFTPEQIYTIKKYLLPYRLIDQQKNHILSLSNKLETPKKILEKQDLIEAELDFKKSMQNISTSKNLQKLDNKNFIEKIFINEGFYSGINLKYPGSGYIDFYKDKLFVLSSRGILTFLNSDDQFQQIKNNLNDFLNYDSMIKGKIWKWFSFKDMLIIYDDIFVSYTEEQKEDCWNTSILRGEINFQSITFKNFFSPSYCIHSSNNLDNEFNAHQSGGRIVKSDGESIFFTIGDYRSRYLAQDEKSVNGKIIEINLNDQSFKIVTLGHRNPQGLYYDKKRKSLIETEHGPFGGDEINIIEKDRIDRGEKLNYGWPVVSAGEHYGGKTEKNQLKYQKYPLYKSHQKYGFIEPIKSFVPSIGISEIVKIGDNKYLVGSMNHQSLYIVMIDDKKDFQILDKIFLGERVRDIVLNKKKVYLFLENSASIGVMSFQ